MLKIETKKEGAELINIEFNGKQMLHDGTEYWQRHAPVLFPIVGQLKEGKTIINNQIYKMGQHGFARDMEFEEIEKTETMNKYLLQSNERTLKHYPYHFSLYITYQIKGNILKTQYKVINNDLREDMLFGIGGHPAFKCDYNSENYQIAFNREENKETIKFLTLENGLISKKPGENLLENNHIVLTKHTFDHDAIIMTNLHSNKVTLKNIKENKDILEFDFTGFPYLALWSKKGASFVCIEPWFNTADETNTDGIFEHKKHILKLKPNEEFTCEYTVKFLD